MYQHMVDVDMPNTVKSVLADILSISPSSEQREFNWFCLILSSERRTPYYKRQVPATLELKCVKLGPTCPNWNQRFCSYQEAVEWKHSEMNSQNLIVLISINLHNWQIQNIWEKVHFLLYLQHSLTNHRYKWIDTQQFKTLLRNLRRILLVVLNASLQRPSCWRHSRVPVM